MVASPPWRETLARYRWLDRYLPGVGFTKFAASIAEADQMVKAATLLLQGAWDAKLADKSNPFDEAIEQKWIKQWLFYANSVRLGSAMMGPDYATFKQGWWDLTNNIAEMDDLIKLKQGEARRSKSPRPARE